jgi:hypothetical protein
MLVHYIFATLARHLPESTIRYIDQSDFIVEVIHQNGTLTY